MGKKPKNKAPRLDSRQRKTKSIEFRLSPSEYEAFDYLARQQSTDRSKLLRIWIARELAKESLGF